VKREVSLGDVHPTLLESGLVWAQADMALRYTKTKFIFANIIFISRNRRESEI
jgi:hypothetical protein